MPTRREFLQHTATTSILAAAPIQLAQAAKNSPVNPKTTLKTRRIPNTELVVSRIAYGTGFLEFSWDKDPDYIPKGVQAIKVAYDNGITFFDLADVYGHGKSETALGKVLKDAPGLREKIVIQSKCGLRIPPDWGPGVSLIGVDISGAHILRSVEGSLQRLGTDRLDVLMLHAPDTLFQPEEIAQAFDELSRSGKVRYFGVSNIGIAHMDLLRKHVRQPLVANQIALGLANYGAIAKAADGGTGGVVDYCRLHDIQVQAHSPLRGGLLAPPADASPQLKQVAQLLKDMAQEKGTNASAIALAWLMRHPVGIVPIIGTANPQYIAENCAADRVELTHDEWHALFSAAAGIQPGKAG